MFYKHIIISLFNPCTLLFTSLQCIHRGALLRHLQSTEESHHVAVAASHQNYSHHLGRVGAFGYVLNKKNKKSVAM